VPTDSVPPETTRLALVGAASLLGKEIKEQLAASGFSADAVTLFDLEEVAGVLTDYGEEARVFTEAVTDQVLAHELICFCGDALTAADYLGPLLGADCLGVDCTGAWLDGDAAPPWVPGVSAPPRLSETRVTAIPPATVIMLSGTLAALGDLAGDASVTVFVPASERGDSGLHELSQQSTAVLNLLDTDQEVFGRQQAFDLWIPPDGHPLSAARLAATLTRLELPVPAISVVSASVFHGMALSVFTAGAAADAAATALNSAGFQLADSPEEATDSPVRVVGTPGMHAHVRDDAGGAWVWVVADNLHARAAATVAAIHTLLGSSPSGALQ